MECAHCVQERCVEGKWDRFGTTARQELEATCDRHLEEMIALYKNFDSEEIKSAVSAMVIEQKKRESFVNG